MTPEVSCASMRGHGASCFNKHVNLAPTGFLITALIVHTISTFMDCGFLGSHTRTYGPLLLLTRFTKRHILTN